LGDPEEGSGQRAEPVENENVNYSVLGLFEATLDFSVVRSGQNASPWPHLFFIFK
jgi:hypothetical protein